MQLCRSAPLRHVYKRTVLYRNYTTQATPPAAIVNSDVYPSPDIEPTPTQIKRLADFISSKRRLVVITGAGCSTESGVPDYRSPNGSYSKGHKPTTYQEFTSSLQTRKRYWARSMFGFAFITQRYPNPTHTSLATLEQQGKINLLITQNVDGLHQKAGQQRVIELHGNTNTVICLACREKTDRAEFQTILQSFNPLWMTSYRPPPSTRPDGDADLGTVDYSTFVVPDCPHCGGMMKPEVVFFGENVAKSVVDKAMGAVVEADGILAVGTSLQVFSSFRFLKAADQKNIPIAILNIGPTRADEMPNLMIKVEGRTGLVLPMVIANIFTKASKAADI